MGGVGHGGVGHWARANSCQSAMKMLAYDGAKELPIAVPLTCKKYFWSNTKSLRVKLMSRRAKSLSSGVSVAVKHLSYSSQARLVGFVIETGIFWVLTELGPF